MVITGLSVIFPKRKRLSGLSIGIQITNCDIFPTMDYYSTGIKGNEVLIYATMSRNVKIIMLNE